MAKKPAPVPRIVNTPVAIRVPHDSRIKAIETLSEAVLAIARALNVSAQVNIRDCTISQVEMGISVTSEQRDFESNG